MQMLLVAGSCITVIALLNVDIGTNVGVETWPTMTHLNAPNDFGLAKSQESKHCMGLPPPSWTIS